MLSCVEIVLTQGKLPLHSLIALMHLFKLSLDTLFMENVHFRVFQLTTSCKCPRSWSICGWLGQPYTYLCCFLCHLWLFIFLWSIKELPNKQPGAQELQCSIGGGPQHCWVTWSRAAVSLLSRSFGLTGTYWDVLINLLFGHHARCPLCLCLLTFLGETERGFPTNATWFLFLFLLVMICPAGHILLPLSLQSWPADSPASFAPEGSSSPTAP